MTATKFATREAWLEAAVDLVRSIFSDHDITIPAVRVSCGWPAVGATRKRNKRIGECWKTESAADNVNHIFITPWLDNVLEVNSDGTADGILPTLVHELIHASDDCESGHRGTFRQRATAVGLRGKMTATHAGEDLTADLQNIAEALGPYPHGKIDIEYSPVKKQGTRMIRLECPECGYLARTTRKWLEVGVPSCPCGAEMEPDVELEDAK